MTKKLPTTDFFNRVLTETTIGLPCTPGYWISKKIRTAGQITQIRISCGGGMGGAQWVSHAIGNITDQIRTEKFVTYTDPAGHERMVNTNNIVEIFVFDILEADFHADNKYASSFFGDRTLRFIAWPAKEHNVKLVAEIEHRHIFDE